MKRVPLFQRRTLWLPTAPGCLVILVALAVAILATAPAAYRWLAQDQRVTASDYMVVEGWLIDPDIASALEIQGKLNCRVIYGTGGPIEHGLELLPFKTWAEAAADRLIVKGFDAARVKAVPAPTVIKDRTYTAALALRDELNRKNIQSGTFLLMTSGTHARRSRMLYQMALGKGRTVLVHSFPPSDYDPSRWWMSSGGVRAVVYEGIACAYTAVWSWFHDPDKDTLPNPPDVK